MANHNKIFNKNLVFFVERHENVSLPLPWKIAKQSKHEVWWQVIKLTKVRFLWCWMPKIMFICSGLFKL